MPILKVPYPLRPYVNGQAEVLLRGKTVGAVMEDLVKSYPGFQPHLYKQDGSMRAYVNLFLDGKNIKDLRGMDTVLTSDDIVNLVPSIAGG